MFFISLLAAAAARPREPRAAPSAQLKRQPVKCMDRVVGPPYGWSGQLDRLHLGCQCCQKCLAFGARNVLADAAVNTDPTRKVAAGAPADIEALGLRPLGGIQVGCREHAQDLGAFFKSDAGHVCRNTRRPAEGMHR